MASTKKPRPIKERFNAAVGVIKTLPKEGPFQPSNTTKLRFYALYKQANEGPCSSPKPSFWDAVGRAKWEAWSVCGKMSSDLAMNMYVEELTQLVETMPQTPEAKEFLKSIGPFYEEEEGTSSDQDEDKEQIVVPSEGSHNEDTGEGERKDEVDGSHVTETKQDASEVEEKVIIPDIHVRESSDSDTSEDFHDSFRELPTCTPMSLQHRNPLPSGVVLEPDSHSPDVPSPQVTSITVPSGSTPGATLTVTGAPRTPRNHTETLENLLPQILNIQSSLHSILQQLGTLVSNLQPHPQSQHLVTPGLVRRRRLLYLVPFLLSWPFILQFFIQFLNQRFGNGDWTLPPNWMFSLLTFLHSTVAVALFTIYTYTQT